ncbi:Holliday junction branch migration protein RuvA [bacterium]|nr:Holliday junction branch migration protein RuvA [bacterium]
MYEYIKGGLANKYANKKGYFVVIDVNGVGYLIEVMKKDYDKISINQSTAILYTVLLHREDSMNLCGFLDMEVRNLFNILVKVSGVGARMALNILNQFELKTLINCVVQEKEKELTQAKGVGVKLAQKIILELRDKFINVELEQEETQSDDIFSEVKNMLLSLQYTNEEISKAQDIVNNMNLEIKTSEDMLREILKVLSA